MTHDHLRKKGWSEKEIEHLSKHYSEYKESKVLLSILASLVLFAVVAVASAYSILSQIIPSALLYSVILLVGVALGGSFGVLLTDINRFSHKHHLFLLICIPLLSVGSFLVSLQSVSAGLYSHNAYIASLLYAIGFVIPYAVLITHRWNLKKQ